MARRFVGLSSAASMGCDRIATGICHIQVSTGVRCDTDRARYIAVASHHAADQCRIAETVTFKGHGRKFARGSAALLYSLLLAASVHESRTGASALDERRAEVNKPFAAGSNVGQERRAVRLKVSLV